MTSTTTDHTDPALRPTTQGPTTQRERGTQLAGRFTAHVTAHVTTHVTTVLAGVLAILKGMPVPPVGRNERAQSTVEYALILLGAAAIALVVVAWVTRSDAIGRLFDTVLARVLQQAG